MLHGEVGGAGGGESTSGEVDVWKFPVQTQARARARYQPRLDHELLSNTWAANIDHSPRIVAFCLGGLAEHGEQRIGFHPALIASETCGHIEARVSKWQVKHVADLDRGSRRARRCNSREPW